MLVVDDDPKFRSYISSGLRESGIDCETAPEGQSALGLFERAGGEPFGLILLDVMMPAFSGWDMLHELRARGRETPVVELRGRSDEIVITVDDAGPGVPPELRRRMFEPFFRGPALAGRRIGYGLGLALTHTAVEGQGGRIEVETSPLGGARFRAFLPRWSDAAPA